MLEKHVSKHKNFLRAVANLTLISGLVVLPWFQFSRSHVHFAGGTLIVHWHPLKNTSGKSPVQGPRRDGHNHSLAELLQIKGIQKTQGLPGLEPQICFVQDFVENFSPHQGIIIDKITVSIPTCRSPPSSILA